jgi:hypothetical protein
MVVTKAARCSKTGSTEAEFKYPKPTEVFGKFLMKRNGRQTFDLEMTPSEL